MALGIGTWTVAILSLWAFKIAESPRDQNLATPDGEYHSFLNPGVEDQEWSQTELCMKYKNLESLSDEELYRINPNSHLGMRILNNFITPAPDNLSKLAKEAFPELETLFNKCRDLFQAGTICLVLAPSIEKEGPVLALSHTLRSTSRIIIECEREDILNAQGGGMKIVVK